MATTIVLHESRQMENASGLDFMMGPISADSAHISTPGLSPEQFQRLLSLIDTPKASYERLLGTVS